MVCLGLEGSSRQMPTVRAAPLLIAVVLQCGYALLRAIRELPTFDSPLSPPSSQGVYCYYVLY